jgi:hypothetical protein
MATLVEKTIGTGGDYADLAAWKASIPANIVTADQLHRGLLLNQEHTTTGFVLSGFTTDSTRYIELTTASGASFMDHANKTTNPGRYSASVGAGIKCTGTTATINVQASYTRISKIQVTNTNTTSTAQPAFYTSGAGVTNITIDNCIFEGYGLNTAIKGIFRMTMPNSFVRNCLVIQLKNDVTAQIATLSNGPTVVNCTFVNLGATAITWGIATATSAAIMKNCYVGGVVSPEDGVVAATKTNCYCSTSATNYTVAALSTANFQNITIGSHDLRLASGSALTDVGVTDATNAPADIVGTSRPQGSAYDIGAYEAPVVTPTGTISYTETSDTFSIAGGINVTSTISHTEDSDVFSITCDVSVTSATAQITYTEASDVFSISASGKVSSTISWTEADDITALTGSVVSTVTITTQPFKNNTGTVLANLTSLTVTVLTASGLTFVKNFTNKTTNGSGVLTIPDNTFTSGVQYAVVVADAFGVIGVEKYTAA